MINYLEDYEYADAKLSDSWVRDEKGAPIYIEAVRNDGTVYARGSITGQFQTVLKNLDLTPMPLGLVNYYQSGATYLSRVPVRAWKQGLRVQNIHSSHPVRLQEVLMSQDFYKAVLGIYPVIEHCAEALINQETSRIAFNRNFSLGAYTKKNGFPIYYKWGQLVGNMKIVKDEFMMFLEDKYKFLQESLDDRHAV